MKNPCYGAFNQPFMAVVWEHLTMEMRLKPWGDRLNPDRLSWDRGLIQIGDRCSSSPRESTLIRDRRQNPDGDRCPSVAILTKLGILHCLIDRFSGV